MHYLLLILIAIIWGSQYVFNVMALEFFTPFGLMTWRIFFGFITLSLLILIIPKERQNSFKLYPKLLGLFILIGAVEAAIPFFLIAYGQRSVNTSITAIVMGLIPMMTIFIEHMSQQRSSIQKEDIIGLSMAFIGLIILVSPSGDAFNVSVKGLMAIILAALCFALALVLMGKIPRDISALRATRFILFIYALPLVSIWFYFNQSAIPTDKTAWGSLLVLGLFASGIVYLLYLTLIRLAGASFTALSNFLVPVVGTFLGVYFFNEPLTLNVLLALVLIVAGLFLTRSTKIKTKKF